MPIVKVEPVSVRGRKDAKRHREKQKEIIRKKLPEIISEESIITKRERKTVKIPIKGVEIPTFRPKRGRGAGVGQGDGKPGDVIGRKRGDGQPGAPGDEPGEDYIETEIDIEELVEMMLEDLGLPRLERKEVEEIEKVLGFEIKGLRKFGPSALLARRETAKAGIKRFWQFLRYLQSESGKDELTCFNALKQANGLIGDALQILKENRVLMTGNQVEPFPVITSDDERYREIQEKTDYESRAVVIAMMDISGSMTIMKKYLARSMLFWLVQFLRKLYSRVEIRFIVHHASARIVDEDLFFKTGESGGTLCYTAYEIGRDLVETEYPPESWNVYVWHFSDGEDFQPEKTIEEVQKLFDLGINAIGYGEIRVDEIHRGSSLVRERSTLWTFFREEFALTEAVQNGLSVLFGDKTKPLVGVLIEDGGQLFPALRFFLDKERWSK